MGKSMDLGQMADRTTRYAIPAEADYVVVDQDGSVRFEVPATVVAARSNGRPKEDSGVYNFKAVVMAQDAPMLPRSVAFRYDILRQWFDGVDLTQRELGELTGYSTSSVANIMGGWNRPNKQFIRIVASLMDCDVKDLLRIED